MDKITRAQLVALGGPSNARYAILHTDGTLYCATSSKVAANDSDFWRDRGYVLKEVVD